MKKTKEVENLAKAFEDFIKAKIARCNLTDTEFGVEFLKDLPETAVDWAEEFDDSVSSVFGIVMAKGL